MRFATAFVALGLASYVSAFPVLALRQATNTTTSGNSTTSTNGTSSSNTTSTGSGAGLGGVAINTTGVTDVGVLSFALFLEQLELSFYKAGVVPYDQSAYEAAGQEDYVRQRFTEIIDEENLHVQVISETIEKMGATANGPCTYDFGITGVEEFLMMAQQVNDVGPGAYTGSAPLISNKQVLLTAAQILSVEARHNAWIRSVNSGDSFPQAFQVPLTPQQAFTVASQFVVSCPSNNTALTVTAAPSLNVTPPQTGNFATGETITLKMGVPFGPAYGVGNATYTPANAPAPTAFNQTGLYAAFLGGQVASLNNYTFVELPSSGEVQIPAGYTGQSYVVVTTSSSSVTDDNTVAGPAIINIPVANATYDLNSTTGS